MELTITQLRRDVYRIAEQVFAGSEVRARPEGRHFRPVREEPPISRFSKLTPMQIINPDSS